MGAGCSLRTLLLAKKLGTAPSEPVTGGDGRGGSGAAAKKFDGGGGALEGAGTTGEGERAVGNSGALGATEGKKEETCLGGSAAGGVCACC